MTQAAGHRHGGRFRVPAPGEGTMATLKTPARQQRWELRGAGLENLALAERETPRPGPGELLVRVDACGICFSDIKILTQGGSHARLVGRDLGRDPVVM